MHLIDLIKEQYAPALKETRLSATTQEQYVSRARSLCRYLDRTLSREPLETDVTTANLRPFFDAHAKGVTPQTSYQCHVQIAHFCKWLREEGLTTEVATERIRRPEMVRTCRQMPGDDVIAAIEAAPDRMKDEYRAAFARAVIALLFGVGLRPGEVKNLQLRDYSPGERSVSIRYGKGKKSRTLYPATEVCETLDAYLKVRHENCKHTYFFAYDKIRRLGDEGLRNLFRELLALAGHRNAKITPHIGRHVCTSRLFASHADINTIRTILGHASFGTTLFYAHSTPEVQRNALERATRPAKAPEREERSETGRRPIAWT